MNFYRIKKNYDEKLWSKEMVKIAVKKEIITSIQYAQITGEEYKEEYNNE